MVAASGRAHLPLTVKLRVATALSQMADDPALSGPALRGLAGLLTHPETGVRRRALFLSVRHGAASVPALVPIIVSGSPRSRLEAGAALVEIGEPQGFRALAQLAHRMPVSRPHGLEPAISTRATGFEPALGPYDAAHLRRVIDNPGAALEERRMAAFRLAQSEGRAAARTLRGLLLSDAPDSLRSAAALALGYIGDAESVAALNKVAAEGGETSQTAALALELITGDVAFNTLLLALLHTEAATRRAAAHALGIAGGERAVPHLLPLLRDPDRRVRQAGMVALRRIEAGSA
jgi:HEAT repeat protein